MAERQWKTGRATVEDRPRDSGGPGVTSAAAPLRAVASRPRRRLCHADNALKLGMGPFQRRSRAAQPAPMTTGCLRDAGAAGRTTNRSPLCGEAPGQRRTLSV